MARGAAKQPETPEQKYQRLMAEGSVIQMYHPRKGVRYITNTDGGIRKARNCGFTDVEYVEETVKRPVVKQASEKASEKASPVGTKPASKSGSKGGE